MSYRSSAEDLTPAKDRTGNRYLRAGILVAIFSFIGYILLLIPQYYLGMPQFTMGYGNRVAKLKEVGMLSGDPMQSASAVIPPPQSYRLGHTEKFIEFSKELFATGAIREIRAKLNRPVTLVPGETTDVDAVFGQWMALSQEKDQTSGTVHNDQAALAVIEGMARCLLYASYWQSAKWDRTPENARPLLARAKVLLKIQAGIDPSLWWWRTDSLLCGQSLLARALEFGWQDPGIVKEVEAELDKIPDYLPLRAANFQILETEVKRLDALREAGIDQLTNSLNFVLLGSVKFTRFFLRIVPTEKALYGFALDRAVKIDEIDKSALPMREKVESALFLTESLTDKALFRSLTTNAETVASMSRMLSRSVALATHRQMIREGVRVAKGAQKDVVFPKDNPTWKAILNGKEPTIFRDTSTCTIMISPTLEFRSGATTSTSQLSPLEALVLAPDGPLKLTFSRKKL